MTDAALSARYGDIVEQSPEPITMISEDYVYEIANESYCRVLGRTREEIVGAHVSKVWGQKHFDTTLRAHLNRCFAGERVQYQEKLAAELRELILHVSFHPYRDRDGAAHALVFATDVTQIRHLETQLQEYQFKDPATGLFNRRSLNVVLQAELEKAKRALGGGGGAPGRTRGATAVDRRAVLLIGLENLDRINQSYGHQFGDVLLESSGLRTQEALRKADFAFPFEGRQMAALLTSVARATDAAKVAEKLTKAIGQPYEHEGKSVFVEARAGVALFPDDGDTVDLLVQNAASAQRQSAESQASFVMFNTDLHAEAVRRLRLEMDLRDAVVDDELVLAYQPVVDTTDGAGVVVGCEALVRWRHPEHGLVAPADFVPVAEETGLITLIGQWALDNACRAAAEVAAARPGAYVAANLSAREFAREDLVDAVVAALQHAGARPADLRLEITETTSVDDLDAVSERIRELQERGVQTVIDDFGSGHSSLTYLKRLPAETVKVDKQFVDGIASDADEREFLERIVGMARSRQKRLSRRGWETAEQASLLSEIGCQLMQGYQFCAPLPLPQLVELVRSGAALPRAGA